MKVKDFIENLKKFDKELEVTISDGYDFIFYHTKEIEFKKYKDFSMKEPVLDIAIGGCRIRDNNDVDEL